MCSRKNKLGGIIGIEKGMNARPLLAAVRYSSVGEASCHFVPRLGLACWPLARGVCGQVDLTAAVDCR